MEDVVEFLEYPKVTESSEQNNSEKNLGTIETG